MRAVLPKRIRSLVEADMTSDPDPIKHLRAQTQVHASLVGIIAHLLEARPGAPERVDPLDWQMVRDFATTVDPLIENPLLLAAARLRYLLIRHYLWPSGEKLLEWLPSPELVTKNTDLESFGKNAEIRPKLEAMKEQLTDRMRRTGSLTDDPTASDHWLSDDQDD